MGGNGDGNGPATAGSTIMRVAQEDERIVPEAGKDFVNTECVRRLTERALAYLEAGLPIHFAGPAGTGKTTLALHVAEKLGNPVILIHGDDEFVSSDLIGKDAGYHKSKLVDNYIHSVLKTEEEMRILWVDFRLTTACLKGYTLIYDEFNRSRAEANNALLSILSERILNVPKLSISGQGYLRLHPSFRAIFTSNPEEYAGTHRAQDALMDRLITLQLGHYDLETEISITVAKSGISRRDAEIIVEIVRELRGVGGGSHRPTIRACIAIAKILVHRGGHARMGDSAFQWACQDVIGSSTAKVTREGESVMSERVGEVLQAVCRRHMTSGRSTSLTARSLPKAAAAADRVPAEQTERSE